MIAFKTFQHSSAPQYPMVGNSSPSTTASPANVRFRWPACIARTRAKSRLDQENCMPLHD
jgi:hypothetical protein